MVPPTEPCVLRSTQPLKVSTRDFSWGKGGRCVWLTTYHPCSAETSRNSGALTYPEPLGPPQPVAGHLYLLYLSLAYPLQGGRSVGRPTSLQGIQHIYIHTIYCCITGTYNKIFIVLTYNFSKERYVLPEDDLRIETCRSLLNVLV